jgi:hypothetical protein
VLFFKSEKDIDEVINNKKDNFPAIMDNEYDLGLFKRFICHRIPERKFNIRGTIFQYVQDVRDFTLVLFIFYLCLFRLCTIHGSINFISFINDDSNWLRWIYTTNRI